jgi:hypothetical protein
MKLKYMVTGFIMMGILVSMYLGVYNEFQNYYGFESDDVKTYNTETGNIMLHLSNLPLIAGMNNVSVAIQNIDSPSEQFDPGSNLKVLGVGVFKVIFGIVTLPISIGNIILLFYGVVVPPIVIIGLQSAFVLFLSLALLRVIFGGIE